MEEARFRRARPKGTLESTPWQNAGHDPTNFTPIVRLTLPGQSSGEKTRAQSAQNNASKKMKMTIKQLTMTLGVAFALSASGQTSGTGNQGNPSAPPPNSSSSQTPPGLEKRDQLPPGLADRTNQFGTQPTLVPTNSFRGTNQFGSATNQFGDTNQFGSTTNPLPQPGRSFGYGSTNRFGGSTNLTPTGRTNSPPGTP